MDAWIGVDPGESGAVILLKEDCTFEYLDWVNGTVMLDKMKEWCTDFNVLGACVEDINLTHTGFKGVSKIMVNSGLWQGLVTSLYVPMYLVRPQKWMKRMFRKSEAGKNTKEKSYNTSVRLYPAQVKDLTGPRGAKKDGRTDALLMATYIKDGYR